MEWVDLQVNGFAGVDFNAAELSAEAVRSCVVRLNEAGTEAFLPTFVSADPEVVVANMRTILDARRRFAECRRSILGFFLEGPFISPDGHHLTDAMLKVYMRAVPLRRLVAVSDAQYPAGMPPGEYNVCGASRT